MNPEQTIEKMKKLKLSAMAEAYQRQLTNPEQFRDLNFDDRLSMMVDYEADIRETKKLERLINNSNMYFKNASPEQINYDPGRGLDRTQFARLLECSFISKNQNIIFEGAVFDSLKRDHISL